MKVTKNRKACKKCDAQSKDCVIFYRPIMKDWYLQVRANWDSMEKAWVYRKVYIDYCPWCGRKLEAVDGCGVNSGYGDDEFIEDEFVESKFDKWKGDFDF